MASWQLTKNFMLQTGIVDGTETPPWHDNTTIPNLYVQSASNAAGFGPGVDPLFPKSTMRKDPGNQPTGVLCLRYESDDGSTVFYPCMDGINKGNWGYNNLQWHGFTLYHKFNDQWHVDFEILLDVRKQRAQSQQSRGRGAVQQWRYALLAAIHELQLSQHGLLRQRLQAGLHRERLWRLAYINYTLDKLDNFTFRPEFYDDPNGWRTGIGKPVKYMEYTLGWQHWLSPQVEFRPEIGYWRSFRTPAFNGDSYAGIAPNKSDMVEFASDVILHF